MEVNLKRILDILFLIVSLGLVMFMVMQCVR